MKRVLCVALLVAPLSALAQSEEPETIDGRPVVRKAVTELEFDTANVDASIVKPSMVLAMEHKPGEHTSLIKVRADFNDIASWEASQQK
jgi:hypothetical protein